MIIVLVGLPGSGKTFLGKQLSKDLKIPYLEDIHILEYLPDNCIIDNPYFCLESARNKLLSFNRNFIFFYFENNPKQCIINDKKRNRNKKATSTINYLTKKYDIINYHFPVYKG